jgi:hypothetical protein
MEPIDNARLEAAVDRANRNWKLPYPECAAKCPVAEPEYCAKICAEKFSVAHLHTRS